MASITPVAMPTDIHVSPKEKPCTAVRMTRSCSSGGAAFPDVLMSGNHAAIDAWRREQSLALTADRRPDLLAGARSEGRLSAADEAFLARRPPAKL